MATTGSGGSHTHTYAPTAGATGPAGPMGPQGVPGPAGPQGPAGVPDTTLAARLDALAARVAALEAAKPPPVVPPTRPFPAPVTTQTIAVPASVDGPGLSAWVRAQPDGSVIAFPAGAVYTLPVALNLDTRKNLVLMGNGATLRSAGGWVEANSVIQAFGASDIAFRDLRIVGATPTPGVYTSGKEGAHGIRLVMGGHIEIDSCDISACYGDAWNTDYWTDGVWVHGSTIRDNGRVACAILSGKSIVIERNTFDHNGGMVLDIEPYEADGGAWDVRFTDNVCTRQAHWDSGDPWNLGYLFGANGGGGGIRDIVFARNRTDEFLSIQVVVPGRTAAGVTLRYANIVVEDNVGAVAAPGPLMHFAHIDGLTLRRNVQPLISGALASVVDCSGVVGA